MDLTKIASLFEREFAISHLIPTLIFAIELYVIGQVFGVELIPGVGGALSDIVAASVFLLGAVVFSVLLMMANPLIMRLVQGYDWHGILEFLGLRWRLVEEFDRRYKSTLAAQQSLDEARKTGAPKPELPGSHGRDLYAAVRDYPDSAEHILAFRIGNFLRAAEVYPRVVYGLDAVGSWPRLQTLIPQETRDAIAAARAQLSFACNVFILTLAALAIALWLTVTMEPLSWSLLAGGILVLLAARRLMFAAGGVYGAHFAAAYDLYRGDLADQLGLDLPRNPEAEREMWREVTRVFLYRSPDAWSRLTRFRKPATGTKPGDPA